MTHSVYTLSSSSWAVQQFQLNGTNVAVGRSRVAGSFPGMTVTTSRIDTGTTAAEIAGDGGTPAAGDVLIAAVVCKTGRTITPPAGWTTVTPITGVGTSDVLLSTFWKVAAAGDITGTLTFTSSGSADLIAYVFSIPQVTIDTGSPVLATLSNVSSVSGTTATGPNAVGFSLFELVATRPLSVLTGARDDGGDIFFLNRSLDGGGTGAPDNINLIGFRYYPAHDQWHVGAAASGGGWA